jgi:hypothetical protein
MEKKNRQIENTPTLSMGPQSSPGAPENLEINEFFSMANHRQKRRFASLDSDMRDIFVSRDAVLLTVVNVKRNDWDI